MPLERAPGERYAPPARQYAPVHPYRLRGFTVGLTAALVTALAMGLLAAIFDVDLGLLAIAAVGGWAIGVAVAWGWWGFGLHPLRAGPPRLAAALGGLAWLGGSVVDYLLSLAILPASTRSFPERVAQQPFGDYLGQQISLLDGLEVVLLVVVAWRSAR